MNTVWYLYLGWIVAGSLLGFAISVIFAGILHLPRRIFLIPYIGIVSLFVYAYLIDEVVRSRTIEAWQSENSN